VLHVMRFMLRQLYVSETVTIHKFSLCVIALVLLSLFSLSLLISSISSAVFQKCLPFLFCCSF